MKPKLLLILLIANSFLMETSFAADPLKFSQLHIKIAGDAVSPTVTTKKQPVEYDLLGASFLDNQNTLHSTFSMNLDMHHVDVSGKAPDLTNPYNLVYIEVINRKLGDASKSLALINPTELKKSRYIKEMFAQNVISQEKEMMKGVTGISFLLSIKIKNATYIWYTLNTPKKRMLQMDELTKIGAIYFFSVQPVTEKDAIVMNIMSAFIDNIYKGKKNTIDIQH